MKRRFVRLHIADDGKGLPSEILTMDPRAYVPAKSPHSRLWTRPWGMQTPKDFMAYAMRELQAQFWYQRDTPGQEDPEEQFAGFFRDKYLAQLAARAPEFTSRVYKCDYTLRVKMLSYSDVDDRLLVLPDEEDVVWRQVRVSGGMALPALVDKVLLPAIGFCRNYHAYSWISQDPPYAALLPKDHGAIDLRHANRDGAGWVDDAKLKVADFFATKGNTALFTYDLGDKFTFLVRVDDIADEGSSTGKVQLLDGAGPAPPEDSCGFSKDLGFVPALMRGKVDVGKASQALNYNGNGGRAKQRFDPKGFDLVRSKQEVQVALSSTTSKTKEPKQFFMPFGGQHMGESHMQEGSNVGKKDPRNLAVCASCGSPKDLKQCARCKLVRYCSKQCQMADWLRHKKDCRHQQGSNAP